MGTQAEMIAIGPFSQDIRSFLMYPSELYDDVEKGAQVIGHVCFVNASNASHLLAEAFGFQLWDFNRHIFKLKSEDEVNWGLLEEALERQECEYEDVQTRILKFMLHGFLFIFDPNG